jgi:hypothetical protein
MLVLMMMMIVFMATIAIMMISICPYYRRSRTTM